VQAGGIEEALRKVTETLRHWANTGRYTKVRFKFRGKPLLPDIPLAAVVAAEGLTFYWTGILRALLVNVAGRSVLDVELVNDSEHHVQKGREELLRGEVDRAIAEFRIALDKQRDNPRAQLNLGVALKLKGDRVAARAALQKARTLDPEGAVGKEAERLLQGLGEEPAMESVPRT
jgi:tetratricopeptide (TPR) repeat protein